MPDEASNEAPAAGARWIKRERWTRIRVLDGICEKTYVVPPLLRWRTFLRRSRARRERDNLQLLLDSGLPAVRPIDTAERRVLGCVVESTLRTEWLEGTENLRERLARGGSMIAASRALGRILGRAHRAGVVLDTASPRNWLVAGDGSGSEPIFCDAALVLHCRRNRFAGRAACVDLYHAALSPSRRVEMSAGTRYRLCESYCDGDRELCRSLVRKISRWSRLEFKMHKALNLVENALLRVLGR